jgi:hypothetical protein
VALRRRVSLAPLTTRRYRAGRHVVEALLDGVPHPLGHFDLVAE